MEPSVLTNEANQLTNGAVEDINIGEPKQAIDKLAKLLELLKDELTILSPGDVEAAEADTVG